MASLPLSALPTTWEPTPQGLGRRGAFTASTAARKRTQETKVCCPPRSPLESSTGTRPIPGLRPLIPPCCPFGQQSRFLLGRQRTQTAEILKASYFPSKHISPDLEALEIPWNISDLTFPLPSPLEPPGLTILMSQPAGERKSFSAGWAVCSLTFQGPGMSELLGLAIQPQSGRAGKSSLEKQALPSS